MLKIKKMHPLAKLPERATVGSAGYDLYACTETTLEINPQACVKIETGIAVAIPQGFAGFIYARSSLGTKHGVVPANCVGVIDSDYRGEIVVVLTNHSNTPYVVAPWERIAQLVIAPVSCPEIIEVHSLDETERGAGGFGSTGKG